MAAASLQRVRLKKLPVQSKAIRAGSSNKQSKQRFFANMGKIGILKNRIQPYVWGSRTAIPLLLGEKTPSPNPIAEMWMGAHPKAPSLVFYQDQWISLDQLIRENPENLLGRKASEKFKNTLPFLFKVLAVEKPLSIQAHPGRIHAKAGFEHENLHQVPMDAFNRNYKDENHKPECVCALTSFWALNGFRRIEDILKNMDAVFPDVLAAEKELLHQKDKRQGLKTFLNALMTMEQERKERLIHAALKRLNASADRSLMAQWIIRLYREYPSDIGIFSPVYLNLIRLESGQAMFLPSGELHAYLEGMGIEVMANSDNVLRGGLTPKHMDIEELLKVLNFEERRINILAGERISETERQYRTGAEEFQLSEITVKQGNIYACSDRKSLEILLWIKGESTVHVLDNGERLEVCKGGSVMIPASVHGYDIIGNAQIYKVCVPV
jgi:mannose-6-phosphate isomerase